MVIETYHERYMFSTEVNFYIGETLRTAVEDSGYNIEDVEEHLQKDGRYMCDSTSRCAIADYEYETGKVIGVKHIQPSSLLIIDLDTIDSNNSFYEFVWGQTNTKFGLLDLIK